MSFRLSRHGRGLHEFIRARPSVISISLRRTAPCSRNAPVMLTPRPRSRHLHTTPVFRDSLFTNFLADEENPPAVQVSSISNAGIKLADGLFLPGPCIFLDGRVFLWDIPMENLNLSVKEGRWNGWDEDRFMLFETVTPRPEILLLGTGKKLLLPPAFLRPYFGGLGIQLDVMDTRNACSTYNLLAEEGRRVAAALLPFTPYAWPKKTAPGSGPS